MFSIETLSSKRVISASALFLFSIIEEIESRSPGNFPERACLTILADIGPSLFEHFNTAIAERTLESKVETSSASG